MRGRIGRTERESHTRSDSQFYRPSSVTKREYDPANEERSKRKATEENRRDDKKSSKKKREDKRERERRDRAGERRGNPSCSNGACAAQHGVPAPASPRTECFVVCARKSVSVLRALLCPPQVSLAWNTLLRLLLFKVRRCTFFLVFLSCQ